MSDNISDPDRIERDLDQTRSRLGGHLSELQDRLSPGQVIDDLMGYFRGSEGADFGRNLLDSVRANPLPAALTGIGLAWLMASGPRQGIGPSMPPARAGRVRVYGTTSGSVSSAGQSSYDVMAERVSSAAQSVTREPGEAEHGYASRLEDARGQAAGLVRQAQESTESYGQRIRDALSAAQQSVMESAHDLRDQIGGMAGSVGNAASSLGGAAQNAASSAGSAAQNAARRAAGAFGQSGQAGGNLMASLAESPVMLGALGLAAGALLGALLPQSDQEEAALGGIAGQARDTARSLAQDAVDRGGRVAQAVLSTGRDSVQAHGLAGGKSAGAFVDAALSGELAGTAKQVVEEVLGAGETSVRKEVLGESQNGQPPSSGI